MKAAIIVVLLICALLYSGDYAAVRLRRAPTGTVQVQPYYSVPLKDGKTEFMLLDPETQTCVKSLLPHFGYSPCWYLDGRKQQRINM